MRKLALLGALLGLGLLSLPASAFAVAASGNDCDYAKSPNQTTSVGVDTDDAGTTGDQVYVYQGTGSTDRAGTTAVGACANLNNSASAGQGGFAEAGVNGTELYAVADGDNNNPNPADGYVGISNFESGTRQSSCNASNAQAGSGSNSGGCGGIKGVLDPIPVDLRGIPTPICGNTSGASWNNTPRDGCYIP